MCGFAGIARSTDRRIAEDALWRMAASIRHRGPDDRNVFVGDGVGLAHVHLNGVDSSGRQPLPNAIGSVVIAYDGEVYNSHELRSELEAAGYRFRSACDAELLIHAYERWGEAMLPRLNGQFAFALYDRKNALIFLARDRFGTRPLFVATVNGDLYFASEAKALFASGEVEAALDLRGLDEAFSLGGTRAPRTVFRDVEQLEPGCCATYVAGRLRTRRYYDLQYPEGVTEADGAIETLDGLMVNSIGLRLGADVPVGGYASGDLDSAITCAVASRLAPDRFQTFSVAFTDLHGEEGASQWAPAVLSSTEHHVVGLTSTDIADVFPDVVWHAETPLLRTAPALRFLLARAARAAGIKALLSGDGSDELFLGHDLFKETMVRLFCLRQPDSRLRPRLFDRLYPHLASTGQAGEFWRQFFLSAGAPTDPVFSHVPRFQIAARIKDFYSPESRAALAGSDPVAELRQSLPASFMQWSPGNRAAYLELTTSLPSYRLSSQGDRMAAAHGIRARLPFLDHRVFEYAASLPTSSKLRGLRDKEILRRWASGFIPVKPTRGAAGPPSPDAAPFFTARPPDYVRELLSPEVVRRTGIFDPASVAGLVRRCVAGRVTGVAENQALVAILSTQLWHHRFLEHPTPTPHLGAPTRRAVAMLD
jgi:asparagine synthase (glutamine-hydrolysing)